MAIQEVIITSLQLYVPLLAFLAGLFIGDALILLGILAGTGKVSFWIVFIFGLIGELTHDIIFYFISNSNLAHYLKKKLKLSKKRNIIANFIERMKGKNYFLPVFLAKFIYGVRDVVILYVSHNTKSFKKYIVAVGLAGLCWVTTILTVGWLAGRGVTELLHILKGIEKGAVIILLSLIALYLLNKFIISAFLRYLKKKRLI
ncbi:hypothetical protein HYW75_06745 [Candidatus Pacearchaeota archaeon]|nr:hypothetical protein [Candidatus Pacearchaeota archaeon]